MDIGKETIGIHLSYLYNRRKDYKLNGVAAGISYNPSFHPQLRLIAEYDSKDFAMGATYLLFNHLHARGGAAENEIPHRRIDVQILSEMK